MSDVNTADRLDQMQAAWGEAPTPEGGGAAGLPPDGDYQFRVVRFDLIESEYNGHLQLLTELEVSAGEYSGRQASIWHDLEEPDRLSWVKGHLKALGLDPDKVELPKILEYVGPALDSIVEGRIKTKKKGEKSYTNVYVNKLLTAGNQEAISAPLGSQPSDTKGGSKDPDDDIPF